MDIQIQTDLPHIDAHIHFPYPALAGSLDKLLAIMRVNQVNLVATPDLAHGNHNPALIHYKSSHPDRAFICGAINYLSVLADPLHASSELVTQIRAMQAAGFDGLKLLESKPMVRKLLGIPLDSPVYEAMWALVEDSGMPVVWHVADPTEFWDPQRVPDWAVKQGWFYGDGTYPALETLYTEVEHILDRHPNLKVILAHFYFLSDQLTRAEEFLLAHPNSCFDLTPGSEMFFNLSCHPQKTRDFFLRFKQRLVYGTDIGASAIGKDPKEGLDQAESLGRAWVVRRFLEGEGQVSIPAGVTHWARNSERIEGIALPADVLTDIFSANFARMFGSIPTPLMRDPALEILDKLAGLIDTRAGRTEESPARQVARELRAY